MRHKVNWTSFECTLAGLACLIFGAILGVAYLGLTA